ncbi:MAG: Fe-S cluster assembly protein SufD [Candidatus Aenigmarchaeota archaeon]|nr:Fe-S cluster assembly protein SufD [Candidatus Aenigmarchaeota archaeon]
MSLKAEIIEDIIKRNKEPEWLAKLRRGSFETFESLPMPTMKDEEYKYTDLKEIDLSKIEAAWKPSEVKFEFDKENETNGLIVTDMRAALEKHGRLVEKYFMKADTKQDKFVSLQQAFWTNGVFVYVPEGMAVERLACEFSGICRNLIILEENSRLNYFENRGNGNIFSADFTEIYLHDNSKLDFVFYQNLPETVFDFSAKAAALQNDASVDWIFGLFGGKLNKLKIETFFRGKGSSSTTNGVFFGHKSQHFAIDTNAYHIAEHTANNILVKGVMAGESSSVYRGLIKIEKQAQQTDSYLADHTLLLSEKALANSIPSLKIDANDVRATHGATVSKIDDEQLFYLMSRGLGRKEAEMLIVKGFFENVLERLGDKEIKAMVAKVIEERMLERE